ncbi:MAG TPA: type II toxin-antitoxin system VapC family toxin [Rhizomicrobium sp.]|nr:type II toxin-antitoxin system VapC family toxin [Rhizomicrobium sp.]
MSVYLDASVIVSIFASDVFTERARAFATSSRSQLIVGSFAAAEFASALGLRCRMGTATPTDAKAALGDFDGWRQRFAAMAELVAEDIRAADGFLRRLDLNLRTPDAIHIAMAGRHGAALATFDDGMAASARALGIPLAAI